MSDIYNQGTVSIAANSHDVTGTDTYFKQLGNIETASLLTLDDITFYQVVEVVSDTQLRIEKLVTRQPYQGEAVTDASYKIRKTFARQTNTGLATEFVNFQNNLLQQKFLFYNWLSSVANSYDVPVSDESSVSILTPKGIQAALQDLEATIALMGEAKTLWGSIENPPETATRWPSIEEITGNINDLLQEFATRWPDFKEVTGTVSETQLPDTVTANKRSLAETPPIKREKSFNQILSDYPTLKSTEVRPTESPNNRRLIQFDDVRGEVHVAMTDRWFSIPTTIASRAFPIFYRGLILRFNNNGKYSGNIKMRVYPMGKGGEGLPNNPPFIVDHQWQEYETTVTDLYKIGEFNSKYFQGIIEYIEIDNGWHQFDANQSDVGSLNAKFDVAFGTFRSPFRSFYQKSDGYWYSDDMLPDNLHTIGDSWVQDANNPRIFTVTEATGSTDALRFFGDSYDDFQFEMVLDVSYVSGALALTVSNSDPNKVYYQGPARFITDERIYFKRAGTTTTAALTVESLKMRIPHYG